MESLKSVVAFSHIPFDEHIKEYDALCDVYDCANGAKWTNNKHWKDPNEPVDNWYGIKVQPEHILTFSNKHIVLGHVTEIDLGHNNIYCGKLEDNGYISKEINKLSHLTSLNLSYNFIQGTIPSAIYDLKNLEYLGLHFNILRGDISTKIGKLKKLKTLQLDHNYLEGPIPSEIGSLTDLTTLCIHVNNLKNGTYTPLPIRRISKKTPILTTIQEAKPTSIKRSTPIPSTFSNLTKLTKFLTYSNRLTGSVAAAVKKNPNYSNWQIENQQDNVTLK